MKRKKYPYLSVVIPAFNEEENVKKGAPEKVLDYLKGQGYLWEVIFVDDGSEDKTADLLSKLSSKYANVSLVRNPHQGKAATVITGMLKAQGQIVMFTDMDQATPISEVEKFFPQFAKYDVVIGSRSGRAGAPVVRKLMAWGFVFLRSLILGLPFRDTQAGFKAFTRAAARDIFENLKIFGRGGEIKEAAVKAGFDLEVLYVARKLGYKVKEVPVRWSYQGTMRVNPFRDSIDGLRDLVRIRWNAVWGKYNN